jgi:hypothetical protein
MIRLWEEQVQTGPQDTGSPGLGGLPAPAGPRHAGAKTKNGLWAIETGQDSPVSTLAGIGIMLEAGLSWGP